MVKSPKKTFYITTPIYYVNDVPHIGHAYTTIITDAISRFKKLAGYEVFFLTGTDEHGQKVEKSAQEKGLKPIELADRMVVRFKDLWQALNINYDYFIRTSQPIHEKGVQKIFKNLLDKRDIYKGIYEGYYCISDEYFIPEDVPFEREGHKTCPDCGTTCGLVSEECYFFKLSAYQDRLLDFYGQNPGFVRPQSRMNEVVSFVKKGLKDLSITRTTVKWGIQIPDDPDHTIYVWFDALNNYLTAIGYDWNLKLYQKFWPADVHFIGKDILRFHAIYWPAFLMAAGFPLPLTVFGHGWWLKDDTKMSKSKGNVLDPHVILKTFGPDPLRYFLLREVPIGLDGNFSHEGFLHRVNSDLANDLGNLVQRTLTMIQNYFGGCIETMDEEKDGDKTLRTTFDSVKERVTAHYERYNLNRSLEDIWTYLNAVNKYLAENEPWKIAKDTTQRKRLGRILYQTAASIRGISLLIYPVMPESAEKIWTHLGEDKPIHETRLSRFKYEGLRLGQNTLKPQPLFPRVQLEDFLKEEDIQPEPIEKEEQMGEITFDEFKKMDLRVGEILKAERVEGTDKLLKIEANIGAETRQMVAGIADTYPPEDLIGKKMVVIVNLKPAVIRGIESRAMLLAAEVEGKAIIPFFIEDVPAGAKVR
ncbi:MAG: methionine--tRNA ligase [Candidatus Aminicenantes bacterium]